jgi:hypothetical protein
MTHATGVTMKVKHILFYAPVRTQGVLQLAELEDGRLCIVHNQKPILERSCPATDIGKAVAEFIHFKRYLSQGK